MNDKRLGYEDEAFPLPIKTMIFTLNGAEIISGRVVHIET